MTSSVPERFRTTSAPRIHTGYTPGYQPMTCASIRDGLRCQLTPGHAGSHLAQTIQMWDDQPQSATTTNRETR